jgi:hypothetical protein
MKWQRYLELTRKQNGNDKFVKFNKFFKFVEFVKFIKVH